MVRLNYGTANYSPRAKSSRLPVFVNKVLLEHSRIHLFNTSSFGCFCSRAFVPAEPDLLSGPLWKEVADPWYGWWRFHCEICVKMLVRTQHLPVTRAAPSLLLSPLHGKYFCERLLFQLYAFSFGNAVCVFIPESRNDKPGLLSFPFAVTFTAQLLKPPHPAHLAV